MNMTHHFLKLNLKYSYLVKHGIKTFEIRFNDRDYHVGDIITFTVVDDNEVVVSSFGDYLINYILKDCPQYGLKDGYCILNIIPLDDIVTWKVKSL